MWLISRIIALFASLVALIGLAVFIGHRQPVSPQIHAWRLDECAKPCWMHITPGRSTVQVAYEQVAAVLKDLGFTLDPLPPKWNDLGAFLEMKDRSGHVDADAIIHFAGQTNLVDEFGFWRGRTDKIMPTFGDFVITFGLPTCVTSVPENNTILLLMYYNDADDESSFGVVMDANSFSWRQPIYAYSMGQNVAPGGENACDTLSRVEKTIPWHGLRSADYYIVYR